MRPIFGAALLILVCPAAVLFSQTHYYGTSLAGFSSPDWVQTNGPAGGFISSIAIDPANPLVVYAAGPRDGIFRSIDGGESWQKLEAGEAFSAVAYAIDPVNPQVIYLADRTAPVLYRSTDGGASWTEYFNAGQEYRRLMSVTIDPGSMLWKSPDRGGSWQRLHDHFNVYRSTELFSDLDGLSLYHTINSAATTRFEDIHVEERVQNYYAVTTSDVNGYENPHFIVLGPVLLTGRRGPDRAGRGLRFLW